ncbi:MAG: universal stress protein [Polyangiaceae bacterium]|nr:universal stress protein [Myxococcales bacterium]MCB9584833.1 universal stress protein [Polyangiaceae bacterium]MCB9607594.1 universal stress protein [Polyangiaceae bacterium]
MTQPIRTALVAIDLKELMPRVLSEGLRAAQRYGLAAHLVHVARGHMDGVILDLPEGSQSLNREEAVSRVRSVVEGEIERLRGAWPSEESIPPCALHVMVGEPTEVIRELEADLEAELVVVGTHGRKGLSRLLLGSVAEHVIRACSVPVLVVHNAPDVPKIEPACPDCLSIRQASGFQKLWCANHQRHDRPHAYHFVGRNVRQHPNHPLVFPMGAQR